jgi:DNA helicase-2/ATP-dependent DNA helicase PcrA
MAKPVLRHGEKPKMLSYAAPAEKWEKTARLVRELQEEGFQTVAIVAKTAEESKQAYKALRDTISELVLLGSKDSRFPGGVTVMPAYLTKGLQFDAVILLDVERYTDSEWDAKLLYVSMTRPVHRLLMLHEAERMTPLLRDVPDELYGRS